MRMRKGSLLKVSLKVNTECIRFTSLAILIIALLPADIKGHCPLVFYLVDVVNGEGVIIVGRRVFVLDDHVGVYDGGVRDAYYEQESPRRRNRHPQSYNRQCRADL